MQRKAAAGEANKIWIEGEMAEVHYHFFAGIRLIGSNTVGKFVNGTFLLVSGVGQEGAVRLQDEETKEEFETSVEQIARHTKLRWALTICSAQDKSLPGTISIHDVESTHFSVTHLYVALSRATDGANVSIAKSFG